MKIAYLTDAVYPYNKGGKEKRLFEISTRLAKKGHDVHIYTMEWWKGSKIIKENNVTLHAISHLYPLYTRNGKRSIKEALAFSSYVFCALFKEDFDILDVDHMPYFPIFPAWLICKIKRKKMIVTWHEYWGDYWFDYLGWKGIFGYGVELVSSLFGKKIAISGLTKKRILGKSQYIPNGVNISLIQSVKPKRKFDVLFVGRLIKEKNVDLVISSVKDKFKLGIIGKGPEEERLMNLAQKYSNIAFLGDVKDQKEVYSYMKGAKVFAFPSEREGFGIVVLEALVCGTPVLVLDAENNASRFLVDKEFVCKKENFEEKLKTYVKSSSSLSFNRNKYNWGRIIKDIEGVYRSE